jgi:hypothetical protein
MDLGIEINRESRAIATPIPTPMGVLVRPAMRGKPNPRLPDVVDYSGFPQRLKRLWGTDSRSSVFPTE